MGRSATGKNKYPKNRKLRGYSNSPKYEIEEERQQAIKLAKRKSRLAKGPAWERNKFLKRTYGISLEDYKRMWNEQQGSCAICGRSETRLQNGKAKALSVDHNHITGKIRRLLCYRCNVGLGLFNESEDILIKASAYLREYNA